MDIFSGVFKFKMLLEFFLHISESVSVYIWPGYLLCNYFCATNLFTIFLISTPFKLFKILLQSIINRTTEYIQFSTIVPYQYK